MSGDKQGEASLCLLRRTPTPLVVTVGLFILALAVFWPYLLDRSLLLGPRSGLGTDIAYRHWPDLTYYARTLREERVIPLWDDAVAGGRPLAGDPGVLWLYPFDLLFLVLPPALAFNWLGMMHLLIGGIGNYFLLRQLEVSRVPSLMGAVAYMLSPKVVAHLAGGHVGLAYGAAWIPWAMIGTRRATGGDWKGTLLAGAALALQLTTHVQIPFYTAWLMVAYAAWHLILSPPLRQTWTRVASTAAILPCFVAFSAAQLFPLVGLLPYASRQAFSLQDAAWYSLPPALVFTLFSPTHFQFPEWVLYPGATPLVLAFVAFFGQKRREAVFWGSVVLFALLYAVGPSTPLFRVLHYVPGFAQLRVPPRIWFLGGFAMTVLTALGAESAIRSITSRRLQRWRNWVRPLTLIIYGSEAATALGLLLTGKHAWRLLGTLIASLVTIGLLIAHQRGKLRGKHLLVGLLMVLLLELVPTARLYTVPIRTEELLQDTPALKFLQKQPGTWRVYSPRGELPYGAAAPDVEAAEGLLALQMGHYVELIKRASGCLVDGYGTGVPPCLTAEVDPTAYQEAQPNPKLLGLLNVRYVLTSLTYDIPGLELVAEFESERIYENEHWLPRVFVVFHADSLPDQDAVLDTLPHTDLGRTALLGESAISLPDQPLAPAGVEVMKDSANSVWINVDSPQAGMVVISRTWMPGWQAWVDGKSAQVHRVHYALQGIVIPPGKHHVQLRYEPVGWRLGWPLSAGMIILAATLVGRWSLDRCLG